MKVLLHILITIIISYSNVNGETNSLCNDPLIHAADRLLNNSVRLYKGNYYWELRGLPSDTSYVTGPYIIPYQNMAPINEGSYVMTVLEGKGRGYTYKATPQRKWYAWYSDGTQWHRGSGWSGYPLPKGIAAGFHNGFYSNPQVIGFANKKVYYYTTREIIWDTDGDRNGYFGGRYGENFPDGITAAFSYPSESNNNEENFYVYLFHGYKYCLRKYFQPKGSPSEWKDVSELFGCSKRDSNEPEIEMSTVEEPNAKNSKFGHTKFGHKKSDANSISKRNDFWLMVIMSIVLILLVILN